MSNSKMSIGQRYATLFIVLYATSVDCYERRQVNVVSGGSTFAVDVYKIWRPMYLANRQIYNDITMTYAAVGSGTGIRRFTDKTYDFAGTDILLEESVYNGTDDIQMFPTMAGPISLAYNIPEMPRACLNTSILNNPRCLNLSRDALLGIFNGTIRYWNDSLITQDNGMLANVTAPITIIIRQDTSGTTELFTSALAAISIEWRAAYGIFSNGCDAKMKPIRWNKQLDVRCAQGSYGMIGQLLAVPYSIGYSASAETRNADLPDARIQNVAGKWIKPSVESTQAAMDSFVQALGPRLTGQIVDSPDAEAYPIAGFTYFLVRKRSMKNCMVAEEIYRYFTFVLKDPLAQNVVADLIKAPLTDKILQKINERVLSQMSCQGVPLSELVHISILKETGAWDAWKLPTAICVSLGFVILAGLVGCFGYVQYVRNKAVLQRTFILEIGMNEHDRTKSSASLASSQGSRSLSKIGSSTAPSSHVSGDFGTDILVVKLVSGERVLAKPICEHFDVENLPWGTRKLLVKFRQELLQTNLVHILGIAKIGVKLHMVSEVPRKGCLQDIIHAGKFHLDLGFRYSIANDLAEGMSYLHKNDILVGELNTSKCYVDSRWNTQVGDWCHPILHKSVKQRYIGYENFYTEVHNALPRDTTAMNEYCRLLYYSAGEVLEQDVKNVFFIGKTSKAADVYSYSMVVYEVFTSLLPFEKVAMLGDMVWQPVMIVAGIKAAMLRPSFPEDLITDVPAAIMIIQKAWDPDPATRPTFLQIKKMIKQANPKSENIVDTMMQAVENYAVSLEEKVQERTRELEKVSANMKQLLHNMLPPSIADKLSKGESVEPEFYDSVTLCFTDIVGFTTLAAESLPIQVVDLLNDLYTSFDGIISNHDVYKVETIGDSYMCISGLPRRNGVNHAGEIGTMMLDMLAQVTKIPIRHKPGATLRVRAGANSGSVMAGVVGLKMPRFCIFGDTVNTAARMESSSLPMRIQISETTKVLLDTFKVYEVHLRGTREVKGKGILTTYWLTGKAGYAKELPIFDPSEDDKLLGMLDKSQIK